MGTKSLTDLTTKGDNTTTRVKSFIIYIYEYILITLQLIHLGNLRDWWDPETMTRFLNKTECMVQQYGNYTIPELNVTLNGINTQGENIADNGGIKGAYKAYSKFFIILFPVFFSLYLTFN